MPSNYTLPQTHAAELPPVDEWRAEAERRLAAAERRCLALTIACAALAGFCLFLACAHYFAIGKQAQSVVGYLYADRIYTDQIAIRSKTYGAPAIMLEEDEDGRASILVRDRIGAPAVTLTPRGVVKAD